MKSKIKSILKWIAIVASCIVLIVLVPVLINECYKYGSGYITVWGASEVLSYYGTIVAAAGAAIGVFLTIQYSQKQFREDTRLKNKPLFSINVIKSRDLFADLNERDQVFFCVDKNDIKVSKHLDEDKKEIIINGGYIETKHFSGSIYKQHYFCGLRRIQNVGLGCAVNVVVAISKMNSPKLTKTMPKTIIVGDSLDIVILFSSDELTVGKYDLKISYYDVLGNRYVQDRFIEVYKGKVGYSVVEDSTILQRQSDGDAVVVV